MSRSDIQAGRAYVELLLKDQAFTKGLKGALGKLKSFSGGVSGISAAIERPGNAGITGAMARALKSFLGFGDEMDKMRQRTGLSVEALSEFAHAAARSGTDIDTVELGVRKMQKALTLAAAGGQEQAKALLSIGLSAAALAKLSPEEQFDKISTAMEGISDPTRRAGVAMELFGRGGTALLPLLENVSELRQEAREMGFTIGGPAAAGAVKLRDALANLWKTVQFGTMAVGEALAPAVSSAVKPIQTILSAGLKWAKQNQAVVRTVLLVAGGVAVAAAAITSLWLATKLVGVGMGFVGSVFAAVSGALSLLLTPMGLIAALLTAGVFVWARYTQSGQNAVSSLMKVFGALAATVKQAFGGIFDALNAGDLSLAGTVAIAGLKLALLQGIAALSDAVGGALGDFIGVFGSELASGDLTGAWDTAVKGMAAVWDSFTEGITAAFTQAARFVVNIWQNATSAIAQYLLKLASGNGILAKALEFIGIDVDTETAKLQQMQQAIQTAPSLPTPRPILPRRRTTAGFSTSMACACRSKTSKAKLRTSRLRSTSSIRSRSTR